MESIKFDKQLHVFMDENLLERVKERVENNKYLYNSSSHFARCAIIAKLNKGEE